MSARNAPAAKAARREERAARKARAAAERPVDALGAAVLGVHTQLHLPRAAVRRAVHRPRMR